MRVGRLLLGYLPIPALRWFQMHLERPAHPVDVRLEPVDADGVACEWLIPAGASRTHVILYLHGGGFVFGWGNMYRHMVSYIARLAGVSALGVAYRLGPEHPFPAALEDCVTAYTWLLKQGIAPENIVIAGDSAGGNLTLTTLLKLRDDGQPLPSAGVCLSPPTDFVTHAASQKYDLVLHPRAMTYFRQAYIGDHDPTDPLLSPIYADPHGLPPLLIQAGEEEMLCDEAIRMADRARQAGVDVRLEVYPRMWHVWQLNYATLPQAIQALADVARFIQQHLGLLANS